MTRNENDHGKLQRAYPRLKDHLQFIASADDASPMQANWEVLMTDILMPKQIVRRHDTTFDHSIHSSILDGVRKFARAVKNRREVRKLGELDDRMLADIGLTQSDLRDAYAVRLSCDPTRLLADRARDMALAIHCAHAGG